MKQIKDSLIKHIKQMRRNKSIKRSLLDPNRREQYLKNSQGQLEQSEYGQTSQFQSIKESKDTLNVTGTQIRKNPQQAVIRVPSNYKNGGSLNQIDSSNESPTKIEPQTSIRTVHDCIESPVRRSVASLGSSKGNQTNFEHESMTHANRPGSSRGSRDENNGQNVSIMETNKMYPQLSPTNHDILQGINQFVSQEEYLEHLPNPQNADLGYASQTIDLNPNDYTISPPEPPLQYETKTIKPFDSSVLTNYVDAKMGPNRQGITPMPLTNHNMMKQTMRIPANKKSQFNQKSPQMNKTEMGQDNRQIFGIGIKFAGSANKDNAEVSQVTHSKFPVNVPIKNNLNLTGNMHHLSRKLSNHLNINQMSENQPMIIKNDVIEIVASTLNETVKQRSPKHYMNIKDGSVNQELRYKYKLDVDTPIATQREGNSVILDIGSLGGDVRQPDIILNHMMTQPKHMINQVVNNRKKFLSLTNRQNFQRDNSRSFLLQKEVEQQILRNSPSFKGNLTMVQNPSQANHTFQAATYQDQISSEVTSIKPNYFGQQRFTQVPQIPNSITLNYGGSLTVQQPQHTLNSFKMPKKTLQPVLNYMTLEQANGQNSHQISAAEAIARERFSQSPIHVQKLQANIVRKPKPLKKLQNRRQGDRDGENFNNSQESILKNKRAAKGFESSKTNDRNQQQSITLMPTVHQTTYENTKAFNSPTRQESVKHGQHMMANSFYSSKTFRKQTYREIISPINDKTRMMNANKDLDRVEGQEFSESTFENQRQHLNNSMISKISKISGEVGMQNQAKVMKRVPMGQEDVINQTIKRSIELQKMPQFPTPNQNYGTTQNSVYLNNFGLNSARKKNQDLNTARLSNESFNKKNTVQQTEPNLKVNDTNFSIRDSQDNFGDNQMIDFKLFSANGLQKNLKDAPQIKISNMPITNRSVRLSTDSQRNANPESPTYERQRSSQLHSSRAGGQYSLQESTQVLESQQASILNNMDNNQIILYQHLKPIINQNSVRDSLRESQQKLKLSQYEQELLESNLKDKDQDLNKDYNNYNKSPKRDTEKGDNFAVMIQSFSKQKEDQQDQSMVSKNESVSQDGHEIESISNGMLTQQRFMDPNPNVQIKAPEKQTSKSKRKKGETTEDHTHSFSIQPKKVNHKKSKKPSEQKVTMLMFDNNALNQTMQVEAREKDKKQIDIGVQSESENLINDQIQQMQQIGEQIWKKDNQDKSKIMRQYVQFRPSNLGQKLLTKQVLSKTSKEQFMTANMKKDAGTDISPASKLKNYTPLRIEQQGEYNMNIITDDDQFGEIQKRKILAEIMSRDSEGDVRETQGIMSFVGNTRDFPYNNDVSQNQTKVNFNHNLITTAHQAQPEYPGHGLSTGFKYYDNVKTISFQTAQNSPEKRHHLTNEQNVIQDHTLESSSKHQSPNMTGIKFAENMNLTQQSNQNSNQQSVRYQTQRFKTDNYNDNNNDLIQNFERRDSFLLRNTKKRKNQQNIQQITNVKAIMINSKTKQLHAFPAGGNPNQKQAYNYKQLLTTTSQLENMNKVLLKQDRGGSTSREMLHLMEQKQQQYQYKNRNGNHGSSKALLRINNIDLNGINQLQAKQYVKYLNQHQIQASPQNLQKFKKFIGAGSQPREITNNSIISGGQKSSKLFIGQSPRKTSKERLIERVNSQSSLPQEINDKLRQNNISLEIGAPNQRSFKNIGYFGGSSTQRINFGGNSTQRFESVKNLEFQRNTSQDNIDSNKGPFQNDVSKFQNHMFLDEENQVIPLGGKVIQLKQVGEAENSGTQQEEVTEVQSKQNHMSPKGIMPEDSITSPNLVYQMSPVNKDPAYSDKQQLVVNPKMKQSSFPLSNVVHLKPQKRYDQSIQRLNESQKKVSESIQNPQTTSNMPAIFSNPMIQSGVIAEIPQIEEALEIQRAINAVNQFSQQYQFKNSPQLNTKIRKEGKHRIHSDLGGVQLKTIRNYNQQFARNTLQPMTQIQEPNQIQLPLLNTRNNPNQTMFNQNEKGVPSRFHKSMLKHVNKATRVQKDITPLEMIHLRNRRHTMTNDEIDHFIKKEQRLMSVTGNSHITTDQSLRNQIQIHKSNNQRDMGMMLQNQVKQKAKRRSQVERIGQKHLNQFNSAMPQNFV